MLSIYQNSNADNYESIKNGFIVRTLEYETIISSLAKRKKGDSIQHELILGRRGSGKSTLLKRIEVEIKENKKLNAKYIPVNLAEEQAGVYRLMDLWEQVLQEIYCQNDKKYEAKSFSEFENEQIYTRYLYSEIHRFCETNKKKIVLLLDNFDRIVGNFSDDGNLLRETLINYRDLVLIAASTRMDEHFWQYDQPFYEFFRRHRLDTLSSKEAFLLLNHWSDALDFDDTERKKIKEFLQNNRGKVENIRLLTDGLPRTMLFFLKLVVQTEKPVEADFLKKIMDEVTPLYQERLGSQTPQMRKIILEMAFMWEAAPTKEIAEQCRMESKLVAANLNTLADRKIIEIIATDKRNHLYRISERFFNMWLIVTQGNPDQKRKARWMSEFLESWYDKQELQDLAIQHIENLILHKISGKQALMLSKGLSQSKYICTRLRDDLIDHTKAELKDSLNNYMIHLPETVREISNKVEICLEQGNYQQAVNLANSIENEDGWKDFLLANIYNNQEKYDLSEKYYLKAIEKGEVRAMFNLGLLYKNQNKQDLAEKYYLMAITKGEVKAIYNLGLLYDNQEKYDLSERYYLMAIEKGDTKAMYNIGLLYYNQKKYDLAERYYLQASEKEYEDAMYNLGILYYYQEKYNLAEKYWLQAIKKEHKNAMFNLGVLYDIQEKYAFAEKYYLLAIEKGDENAMFNLGNLYDNQEKYDLAEKYYLIAIDKGDEKAMNNLGLLYYNQEKYDLAERYYLMAIEKGHENAMYNLALIYYSQNRNKEQAKQYIGRYKEDDIGKIIIEIWAGVFNAVEERTIAACREEWEDADFIEDLLIHHQKSLVDKLFHHTEFGKRLQEQYTVLYYASQILNGKGNENNLRLRIPPELESTVKDVLDNIKAEQKRYSK